MSEEDNTQGDMETSIEGNQVENLSQPELESAPENKSVSEGLGEDEVSEQNDTISYSKNARTGVRIN